MKLANVRNGVRQGGVSSGIFFVVYIDELLTILRNSGLGCRIFGVFYGALIYADDIFLLSASRTGLQGMISLSHQFATKVNLKFGTNVDPKKSKTKCIIFSKNKKNMDGVKEITLGDHRLPWVTQVNHLGHTLQQDNSMSIDINSKRGMFVGRINSLLQEFHYASPEILMKFAQSYACNIYGSNTRNLFSPECQRIYTSYNVAVRTILNLPRTTHRYLLEPLSDYPHLFAQLTSRYVRFSRSLLENQAIEVRFLSRVSATSKRSLLSRSLSRIAEMTNFSGDITELSAQTVRQNIVYAQTPEEEKWRMEVIKDMKDVIACGTVNSNLSMEEASDILTFACTS